MKKITLLQVLIGMVIILANANCKKEPLCSSCASSVIKINTAPVVSAGTDTILFSSHNRVTLSGCAVDKEANINGYKWTKISGPASYSFTDSTKPVTEVTNLVNGYYAFQLAVTDNAGLSDSAVVRIMVNPATAGTNENIFYDLEWDCWWGCAISVTSPLVPASGVKAVLIARDFSSKWILLADRDLPGYNYTYGQSGGSLWISSIFNSIQDDTPDIKIIY